MAVQQAQVILTDNRAHIETVEDRGSATRVRVTIQDLEGSQLSLPRHRPSDRAGPVSWANLWSIFTHPVTEAALATMYESYLHGGSG